MQFYESLSFARLREAMSILGFSGSIQDSIFKTVASLLHLGNVQFQEQESGAGLLIKNPEGEGPVDSFHKVRADVFSFFFLSPVSRSVDKRR